MEKVAESSSPLRDHGHMLLLAATAAAKAAFLGCAFGTPEGAP
jgi:hypothetical protein